MKLILNVDLFKLLGLPVSDVLKLRLLSKKCDETIKSRDRFWKLAFPFFSLDAPTGKSLADHVISACHMHYLTSRLYNAKEISTSCSKEKTSLKGMIATRKRNIEQLTEELEKFEKRLKVVEKEHQVYGDRVKNTRKQLKDEYGIKRNDMVKVENKISRFKSKWE